MLSKRSVTLKTKNHLFSTVVLKLSVPQNHQLEGLLDTACWTPPPEFWIQVWVGPENLHFQQADDDAGPGTTL